MNDGKIFNEQPRMRKEKDGRYEASPIVAHSPSYQQPYSEAAEQTAMALEQRKVRRG